MHIEEASYRLRRQAGPGAEAVVGHEAPRPGAVVELDDEHDAGVAQGVDGTLPPQSEVAPEVLA